MASQNPPKDVKNKLKIPLTLNQATLVSTVFDVTFDGLCTMVTLKERQ